MKSGIFLFFIFLITGLAARAGISISAQDVATGHYTYQLGWDGMAATGADAGDKKPGTFFGDVSASSGVAIANDPAHDVRTVNVKPGVTSAWFEFKFDFTRTGKRAVKMSVRDVLRLEPEAGNWAAFSVLWRAGDAGPWHELRTLNGTRFSAPGAVTSEVALPAPAAVVYYRVQFTSEKPVTYPWGRGRWNFLTTANAAGSCFRVVFDLVSVEAAAKASTLAKAAPPAKVDAFAAASPWGISAHPLRTTEWPRLDTEVERVGQAGMMWLREDFSLPRILTRDGRRDYSKFDTLVDKLFRAGVGIVGLLSAYDGDLRGMGYGDIAPIYRHPEVWREYVRAMVGRYHDRVHCWAIWNEEDGGFWGGAPDAGQYVSLLKIAHDEIKAIDPDATVIMGGLEYWNSDYLRAVYRAGGKGYFDVVGVHRYGPGPDGDATVARTMREFRALMAAHGQAAVPVWILESGGSTFQAQLLAREPLFMDKSVRFALARLEHPIPQGAPLRACIVVSPRLGKPGEAATTRSWLPGITLEPVTPDMLGKLDPKECPILVSDIGLHIDEPMMEPMRAYVERGGLLVAVGHPPFYVLHTLDANGIWQSREAADKVYPFFRMGLGVWWKTKGVPKSSTHVAVPAVVVAGGVPQVDGVYVTRFFTAANLEPGDTFQPILSAVDDKDEPVAAAIALYTYHDWKGGIIAVNPSLASGWTEQQQAMFLPRMYLSYLASQAGVEKIFIYDLHDDGQNSEEPENNFGLTHWDWSPKPAFVAYREMTQALGKAPTFVKRLATANASQWAVVFRKAEDGRLVLAAWSTNANGAFTVTGVDGADGKGWSVNGNSVRYLTLPVGVDVEGIKIEKPKG